MEHVCSDHQGAVAAARYQRDITPLDHSAFESTFQKLDYEMFIDYAINDISDPDEMASFEVDVKNGGSQSYWSNYNDPTAIKLVHQAEAEYNSSKRAALYAQIQEIVAAGRSFRPSRLPSLHLCRLETGQRLRSQSWRRLPARERLASLRGTMAGYTARRLLSAVFVIFGVTLATFLLMHVEPGDPARSVLGIRASPSAVAALRRQWGLNSSLPEQLGRFLSQLFQGNLGQSYIYHVSTASLIGSRVGETAALVAVAAVFAVVITVPMATLAAARKDGVADHHGPGFVRCRPCPPGLLVRHPAYRDIRRTPARAACRRRGERVWPGISSRSCSRPSLPPSPSRRSWCAV